MVLHGMGDHCQLFNGFALTLVQQKFLVFGHDDGKYLTCLISVNCG